MGRRVTVTIVRHGETDHNKAGIVQGHLDVPLNAQGVAQAAVTGRWFAEQGIRFDEAWSSDLSRARVSQLELKKDQRIRERFLGALQGKRRGDPGADPKTVEPIKELRQRLWSFWDERFSPSGPSQADSDSPPNGSRSGAEQQMLYVSHGAAIREFITSLVEMADRKERDFELVLPADEAEMIRTGSKRIDNCSRTVIEMEWLDQDTAPARWQGRLRLYADDSHFIDSSRAPSPTANADVVE
ncbi:phosphoglycerate mutase-like protein [Rhodotorula sp. JG-1b]|nr:phosphoglycerate mutase-like protein [Rhodotorula sp. JG-1b]